MFIECSGWGIVLHSHTYYANTCLFKKFIAESSETESKQKDDFIEEWGCKIGLMKNLLGIVVLGLSC